MSGHGRGEGPQAGMWRLRAGHINDDQLEISADVVGALAVWGRGSLQAIKTRMMGSVEAWRSCPPILAGLLR
jgi:hypothetical protein